MLVFDCEKVTIECDLSGVSILVLVDVGLRRNQEQTTAYIYISFNPCFSGCWSSTSGVIESYCSPINVSILVLVDVGLRQSRSCAEGVLASEFQSLF